MEDAGDSPPDSSLPEPDTGRQFGLAALSPYAKPFNWPIILALAVAYGVIHYNIDSLKLTQALKLAMTPLAGLIAIGLYDLLKTRVEPKAPQKNVDKAAAWITSLASLTILFILVHVAIPEGDIRDALGAVSAVLFIATIVLFLLARNISDFNTRHWEGSDTYPPARYPLAWLIDAIIVIVSSTLIGAAVILFVNLVCDDRYGANAPVTLSILAAVTWIYQVAAIRLWGCTCGQRVVRVRLVTATSDLDRPGFVRVALRTLLPLAPFYAFYMLIYFEGEGSVNLDDGALRLVFGGIAVLAALGLLLGNLSIAILRNMHPQGQGLLDLIAKTVVLPVDEVTEANS